jgi:hypothetical protein
VKPLDAHAFVARDWAGMAALKRSHWAERFRAEGSEATVRASSALWIHVRQIRSDWPTARDRSDDLAHHIELKRQLDRTAHAFARR